MKNIKLRTFAVLTAAILPLTVLISPSANAAATQTFKNLYLSVTAPTTVKMPKGDCGSFKVSYKLGLKAIQRGYGYSIISVMSGEDVAAGKYFSYNLQMSDDAPTSGSFTIKFCKSDWMDDTDARIGLTPGTYDLGFVTSYDIDTEKWSRIKFVK